MLHESKGIQGCTIHQNQAAAVHLASIKNREMPAATRGILLQDAEELANHCWLLVWVRRDVGAK
jgi:hypothetical protein